MFKQESYLNPIFSLIDSQQPIFLEFSLEGVKGNFVNEVGVFNVDDDRGTIAGITPGTPAYTTAAINRARVIFSTLPRPTFANLTFKRKLAFTGGSKLAFYLIPNGITEASSKVLFAHPLANTGQTNYSQISDFSQTGFTLAWEDGGDGQTDFDFNDLFVKVQVTDSAPPPETILQDQAEIIDLTTQKGLIPVTIVTNGEAVYGNSFGFYIIDDRSGRIGNLQPGDPGYAEAAVKNRLNDLNGFPSGVLIAPFFISNGTPSGFLSQNPQNLGIVGGAVAYFIFREANPDRLNHIRLLGDNTFAFEDLLGGGDFDYNDLVIQLQLNTVANQVPRGEAIGDRNATEKQPFYLDISQNFRDPDGDRLTYNASLTGGANLPNWLKFDSITGTFTGTPPQGSQGKLLLEITANDGRKGLVSQAFALNISAPISNNDTIKPTASNLIVNPITTSGGTKHTFTVQYGDNLAIAVNSLDSNDLEVINPTGETIPATLLSVTPNANSSLLTATYEINAPGGIWDSTDNGNYQIKLLENQVLDISENGASSINLGNFAVNVATLPTNATVTLAVAPVSIAEDNPTGLVYTFTRNDSINSPLASSLTVNFNVGGSAIYGVGNDYTQTGATTFNSSTGTVTFSPNLTTATVTLTSRADATNETDETVSLTLAAGGGYVIGTALPVTVTIVNDDQPTWYDFSGGTYSAIEGNTVATNAVVTLIRSGKIDVASSVDVVINGGTGTTGVDFTGGTFTINFIAGETSKSIPLQILGDTLLEGDETINLSLTNFSGGGMVGVSHPTAILTLVNDDLPIYYDFAVPNFSVIEGDNTQVTNLVTVMRSGNTSLNSSVDVTLTGGSNNPATPGIDFNGTPITLNFLPGETSKSVPLAIFGEITNESNEAIALSFSNFSNGGNNGTTNPTATLTLINDDDPPIYDFTLGNFNTTEGNNNNITNIVTVTRTGDTTINSSVNVTLTSLTATTGVDFNSTPVTVNFAPGDTVKAVPIEVFGEITNETNETLALAFNNFSNGGRAGTTNPTAILTLNNDDSPPIYDFGAASYTTVEGDTNNTVNLVIVNRTGDTTINSSVDVILTGGTATGGSDFNATPVTLNFLAGETFKPVPIQILGEIGNEGNETINLSLSNFTVGGSSGVTYPTTVLTLTNDDSPPIYNFSTATYSVNEGNTTNTTNVVTLLRSGDTTITSSVDVTLTGGTATAGSDFTATPITVTFTPTQTTKTIPISILGETTFEGDETINLSLTNFTASGSAGSQSTATLTLLNDDVAVNTIQGTKWNDLNGNGVKDSGEPGLANWRIYVDANNNGKLDTGELNTLTNASGDYTITGLVAGTYTVAEVRQLCWQNTFPGTTTVTPGAGTAANILITHNNTIQKYSQGGTLLTPAITVPYGAGARPATESVRDLVVNNSGLISIYNGTFTPYITNYDPALSSWNHLNATGWSTANVIHWGGVATYQNYAYASDTSTAGAAPIGLMRFDFSNNTSVRFANTLEFADVTMGLNGLIYGLETSHNRVHVYDPLTLDFIGTVNLPQQVSGIAVNQAGEIWGSGYITDRNLYRFKCNGTILGSFNTNKTYMQDVDISFDGKIVIGSRFGDVYVTNDSFSSFTSFNIGSNPTFVAWDTYQQPTITTTLNPTHSVTLGGGSTVTGIDFGAIMI